MQHGQGLLVLPLRHEFFNDLHTRVSPTGGVGRCLLPKDFPARLSTGRGGVKGVFMVQFRFLVRFLNLAYDKPQRSAFYAAFRWFTFAISEIRREVLSLY